MGLRLLAILLLVHAAIAPAMAAARTDRLIAGAESSCCGSACACRKACPCATSDDPERPVQDTPPATPPRGADESLRNLTLPGARVIDSVRPAAQISAPIVTDRSRSLPPAAFRGGTAQASLCVRTT